MLLVLSILSGIVCQLLYRTYWAVTCFYSISLLLPLYTLLVFTQSVWMLYFYHWNKTLSYPYMWQIYRDLYTASSVKSVPFHSCVLSPTLVETQCGFYVPSLVWWWVFGTCICTGYLCCKLLRNRLVTFFMVGLLVISFGCPVTIDFTLPDTMTV